MAKSERSEADVLNDIERRARKGKATKQELRLLAEAKQVYKVDNKILNASCALCGNSSGYDKESLKGSTWKTNGIKNVLCCQCEDEIFEKIGKTRDNPLNIVLEWLKHRRLCTTCGFVLKSGHYCDNCKERVAVECDTDGLIKSLRKQFLGVKHGE